MTQYTVRFATNGWIVESTNGDESTEIVGAELNNETEAFIAFLRDVDSQFGPSSGRYSQDRIHIFSMPGDNYSGGITQEKREELIYLRDSISDILEKM